MEKFKKRIPIEQPGGQNEELAQYIEQLDTLTDRLLAAKNWDQSIQELGAHNMSAYLLGDKIDAQLYEYMTQATEQSPTHVLHSINKIVRELISIWDTSVVQEKTTASAATRAQHSHYVRRSLIDLNSDLLNILMKIEKKELHLTHALAKTAESLRDFSFRIKKYW